MVLSPEQYENASIPMVSKLLGIVIDVKPVQPRKALFPMLFTPSGILIEVIFTQLEKA